DEAGDERLHRSEGAVRLELHQDNITPDLGAAVPRSMARNDDLVAVGGREHGPRVEAHAQGSRVRPEQRNRLGELVARVAPSELLVRDVALVTVREAEVVLAGLGHPVEFVFGNVFRQPVALVFREVKLLERRMPVHADDLADAGGNHLQPTAIQVQTIDFGMPLGWHADVARRTDLEIELLVGTDGEKFPTVRLVLWQVAEDDGRLWRIVEFALDVVDFRDLGQLSDVKRPLVQDNAVGAVKSRCDDLDFARSALVDNGVDLVLEAAPDEHRALIAHAQRAAV